MLSWTRSKILIISEEVFEVSVRTRKECIGNMPGVGKKRN